MKARAAFFERAGQPIEIREVEVPEPEPGALIVKIRLADICASDVHAWHGETPRSGPTILGHEMMGTVYQLGPDVTTDSLGQPLQEGDRVVYSYILPCLQCRTCRSGNTARCPSRILSGRARSDQFPYLTGAFAEYYYLRPGHFVVKVTDDLPDELLAPLNCALVQVMTGFRRAGLQWGQKVVIQGAGGLGLNAAAVARELGAEQVVVLDKLPERLELAKQFGADQVVNVDDFPNEVERGRAVRRLLNGGADVALELVGSPQVIPEGLSMLAREGTYVIIGSIKVGHKIDFDPLWLVGFNRTMIGIGGYDPETVALALSFLKRAKDRYPFDRIVSHKFKLDEIETAFEKAAKGEVVRASIVFD
jgi:putative phosphonate catabolism associated alcohol dehydrogenase